MADKFVLADFLVQVFWAALSYVAGLLSGRKR